jgi:YD repeat-containing protein
MGEKQIVYLPELIVEEHLGHRLPEAVAQEFTYDGQRYRVRQRDPLRQEGQVPCELIDDSPDRTANVARRRRR